LAQLNRDSVQDLYPEDVAKGLAEGRILLVDVREPDETDVERYPDAVYMPMSEFNPTALPDPAGREVVFACRSGNRSVTASLIAQNAGLPYNKHLAGGIKGWKAAGLPTES
jgi:rhodanese-related sulfurtransferase